jgi:hypothetical protein
VIVDLPSPAFPSTEPPSRDADSDEQPNHDTEHEPRPGRCPRRRGPRLRRLLLITHGLSWALFVAVLVITHERLRVDRARAGECDRAPAQGARPRNALTDSSPPHRHGTVRSIGWRLNPVLPGRLEPVAAVHRFAASSIR